MSETTFAEPPIPYSTEIIEMGYYEEKEKVYAINMPRDDWEVLVNDLLNETVLYDQISEEMRDTAYHMTHYPLGTWMDDKRGCGCVVGEYLIAHDLVYREKDEDNDTIVNELGKMGEKGDILSSFGNTIDVKLCSHLRSHGSHSEPTYQYIMDVVVVFI